MLARQREELAKLMLSLPRTGGLWGPGCDDVRRENIFSPNQKLQIGLRDVQQGEPPRFCIESQTRRVWLPQFLETELQTDTDTLVKFPFNQNNLPQTAFFIIKLLIHSLLYWPSTHLCEIQGIFNQFFPYFGQLGHFSSKSPLYRLCIFFNIVQKGGQTHVEKIRIL